MTEFYFVRHCETDMNRMRHLVGGQSNHTPATERGLVQSRQFGSYVRKEKLMPHAVYSSGAVRTNTTAEIALDEAGITANIIVDPRLLEMSQGIYEGSLRDQVYTDANKKIYRIETMDGKFPGGESLVDLQQRKRAFLDEKHIEYPDGVILVFGHGLAIRALVGQIRGSTRQQILDTEMDNMTMTRIDVVDGQPKIIYFAKNVIDQESV